ncbi:hypothetical protein CSUI_007602, partial [Cystoisospora suis]
EEKEDARERGGDKRTKGGKVVFELSCLLLCIEDAVSFVLKRHDR